MRRPALLSILVTLLAFGIGLLPDLYAQKGKKGGGDVPLNLQAYEFVIDEHDTTGFYGLTYGDPSSEACSEDNVPGGILSQPSNYKGDGVGLTIVPAYEFGTPWATVDDFRANATTYSDGADCTTAGCLQARFTQGLKVLGLDTRGSTRQITVDFRGDCSEAPACTGPAGDSQKIVDAFGSDVIVIDGLLNVFLESDYTQMDVCDTANGGQFGRACFEAGNAFAKFWFTDPAGTTWRIDWNFLRVLRMNANTWYFIADECDGSQVAGLSHLEPSRRKNPKTVFDGFFKIPFFFSAIRADQ